MRLTIENLRTGYGTTMVINDLSLELESGKSLAVTGRNGMGKTTLAKAIMGYLPSKTGRICLGEVDLTQSHTHERARHHIGYGPQEAGLFGELTVEENLRLVARERGRSPLDEVPVEFGVLTRRRRQKAATLSGGEQKMLILTKALISGSALLLLDEITEGLQPSMVDAVVSVLKKTQSERTQSILLIEQNLEAAFEIADRVVVLSRGEVVMDVDASHKNAKAEVRAGMMPS